MYELLQIFAAFVIADAIAALYHLVTDLGYNIPAQVGFFRKHHEEPWTMTFDLQPVLGGVPLIILGCFVQPWFFVSLGIFVALAQVPHYYSHHTKNIPGIVRFLQDYGIFINEEKHNRHHNSENFDTDFCVLSGWNNWWVSPLGKWMQRFKRT